MSKCVVGLSIYKNINYILAIILGNYKVSLLDFKHHINHFKPVRYYIHVKMANLILQPIMNGRSSSKIIINLEDEKTSASFQLIFNLLYRTVLI